MTKFYYVCTILGITQERPNINHELIHYNLDFRIGPGFSPDGTPYVGENKSAVAGIYSSDRQKAILVGRKIITLDEALRIQLEAERIFNLPKEVRWSETDSGKPDFLICP